jgi:iron complex transport system ATP-binding protein
MIDIESLVCGYGDRDVLVDVNLRLEGGEMAGILGPNGSGKSTLLLAIAGVVPIRKGRIRLAGQEAGDKGSGWRARKVASVPQRSAPSFPFSCLSVVLMGRYPYLTGWGDYSARDMDVALEVMEQTETLFLAHRRINEVSGGEAQRVLIARALAQETAVVLLDEATSSLDVARKIHMFDLLSRKNQEGTTLLCVMHDLNLAALYCRRLIFLKDGEIVLDGPTEETFNDRKLSEIYGTDIRVSRHPITGCPQAHFVPGPFAASAA